MTLIEEDIRIVRYSKEDKKVWNSFVENSKNGTFLLKRDYMDYHEDKFPDNSYLIYKKEKLYCLLPATRNNEILTSHAGLTYGGLIMNTTCTASGILQVFNNLLKYLKRTGIKKFIYKAIPYIYHIHPAEEDLYALFRNGAQLFGRNISSVIYLDSRIPYSPMRNRILKKLEQKSIKVLKSDNYELFWEILTKNLKDKYNSSPVHTLEEIKNLATIFPDNIQLYVAMKDDEMLGGMVFYISKNVARSQYISATPKGKKIGAIDALNNFMFNMAVNDLKFYDMGTSNEQGGKYLNESLIHNKESFGGRAVCYDTYLINL